MEREKRKGELAPLFYQLKVDTNYVKNKLGAAIIKLHDLLQKLPKKVIEKYTNKFLGPAIDLIHFYLGNKVT